MRIQLKKGGVWERDYNIQATLKLVTMNMIGNKQKIFLITAEDVDSVPIHSLKIHFNIIRETIDFAQLLPQLYQDRILSYEEEIAKIQSENSRALQTMCLVHMIEKKGKAGVKGFIESLERETTNIGHRDLAQELKNGNYYFTLLWEKKNT